MGYQIYKVGHRWGGYGVPAYCEHPDCKEEIDRGMSFACGGEPFCEYGCDKYFCGKHLKYTCVIELYEEDHECDEKENECEIRELCEACSTGKGEFDYKPEHPTWVKHLLKDKSWAKWRKENPEEVKELKLLQPPLTIPI